MWTYLLELIAFVNMKTTTKNEMDVTGGYLQALDVKQNLNWAEK